MNFNTFGAIAALSSLDKKKTSKQDRTRAVLFGAFSSDPLTGIIAGQKVKSDTQKKESQKQVISKSLKIRELEAEILDLQAKIKTEPAETDVEAVECRELKSSVAALVREYKKLKPAELKAIEGLPGFQGALDKLMG